MGLIALKCPSCGAEVQLDESCEFGFCTYCGTKVMQEKIIVDHRGSIKIEGTATAESLLERAQIMLQDGDFSNADSYFNRVLDIDPHCAAAYWGKLCCKIKVMSDDGVCIYPYSILDDINYKKAIEFSEGAEQEKYSSLAQKTVANQDALVKRQQKKVYNDSRYIIRGRVLLAFDTSVILSSIVTVVGSMSANNNLLPRFFGIMILTFCIAFLLFAFKSKSDFQALRAYKKGQQIQITPVLWKSDDVMRKEKIGHAFGWVCFGIAIAFAFVALIMVLTGLE